MAESGIVLTQQDMEQFRCGAYGEQSAEVRSAWVRCMLTLLPKIRSTYKIGVQKTRTLSSQTSASDEALLMWFLTLYSETWIDNHNNNDDETRGHDMGPDPRKKRKYEKMGEQHSRTKLHLYNDLVLQVKNRRVDPTTGNEWDRALMEAAAGGFYGNDVAESQPDTSLQKAPIDITGCVLDEDFYNSLPKVGV